MYKRNERLNLIRKRVDQYGQVAVKDLAIFLQVTPETVRKDLETLENDKLITRTHGGAIQYNHINKEKSYANKWQKQSQVKERIAKKAALQIQSGEIIVIDGGTTTGRIPQYLNDITQTTIVTNSLKIADELNRAIEEQRIQAEVIMLAGKTNTEQDVVRGHMTNELLQRFKFDKAFISCGSFDTSDCYEFDLEEAHASHIMIQKSQLSYLLADSSKRDAHASYRIDAFSEIDYMISDYAKPQNIEYFNQKHWLQI